MTPCRRRENTVNRFEICTGKHHSPHGVAVRTLYLLVTAREAPAAASAGGFRLTSADLALAMSPVVYCWSRALRGATLQQALGALAAVWGIMIAAKRCGSTGAGR
ncbi:hypothetical protein KCP74_18920 [Salmonella enterica subsp. enterica]|nr:hypothetical protein KCP74_18920 [Salmonella enterica subsp. enterica]